VTLAETLSAQRARQRPEPGRFTGSGRVSFVRVDDTNETVAKNRDVEIDQETDSLVREFQVCQKLLLVQVLEFLGGFQLNNHSIICQQIKAKSDF
jgi:hypothetical protein